MVCRWLLRWGYFRRSGKVLWSFKCSRSILRIRTSTTKIYPSDEWSELIMRKDKVWGEKYFDLIKVYGPSYGYTPQPHKCILVTSDRNSSCAKSKFERYGIEVVTESRSLGGFIGSPTLRSDWLREKASFWEKAGKTMARARKNSLRQPVLR